MEDTDEIEGLRDRLRAAHSAAGHDDDLGRTIESDSWEHLRTTTEMNSSSHAKTAQHPIPTELIEASRPTREHRPVVPRPDDPRWTDAIAHVTPEHSLALPEDLARRLKSGERVRLKIFFDE